MKPPARAELIRKHGVLWVAFGASLWGFDSVLRQPLTSSLSSSTIVFYEHVLLAVVLLPAAIAGRRQWRAFGWAQWAAVLWVAWGGSALGTICYTHALKLGNPTTVVFLQKMQPFLAVLLAWIWLREREPLRGRFWLRFAAAVGAAFLISFGGDLGWEPQRSVFELSSFWALAAAAIWGSCTVAGRYVIPGASPRLLTSLRVILALPLLAMLVLAGSPTVSFPSVAPGDWGSLVFIALVPGLFGLVLYYRGLSGTPASLATLAELCFPATAAVLNWIFLEARVTPIQLIGVGLLWLAVLWKHTKAAVPAGADSDM